jgi:hypothetical protein
LTSIQKHNNYYYINRQYNKISKRELNLCIWQIFMFFKLKQNTQMYKKNVFEYRSAVASHVLNQRLLISLNYIRWRVYVTCTHGLPRIALEGLRDVVCVHYLTSTNSIKPSLLFSCNFDVINSSEEFLKIERNNNYSISDTYWVFKHCVSLATSYFYKHKLYRLSIIIVVLGRSTIISPLYFISYDIGISYTYKVHIVFICAVFFTS